jgi:tellurite resistance protein TehA-like permease
MRRRFEWGLLALGLYMLSLVTPCVIAQKLFGGGAQSEAGIACLLLGWFTIPWYANPLLLFAVIANALRAHEVATVFSATALVAALTLFGYDVREMQPDIGYGIWVASIVATMVASIVRIHDRNEREARERELLRSMHGISRGP